MITLQQFAAVLLLLAVVGVRAADDLVVTSSSGVKVVLEGQKPWLKIYPNASRTTDYVSMSFGRAEEFDSATMKPLPTSSIKSMAEQATYNVTTGEALCTVDAHMASYGRADVEPRTADDQASRRPRTCRAPTSLLDLHQPHLGKSYVLSIDTS